MIHDTQIQTSDGKKILKVSQKMTKSELKKAFESKLISEERFKNELFKLETQTQVKVLRKSVRLPVALNEEEFMNLFKHTKKQHHKLAFLLGYGAGLRISEIIHLQPRHININERKINIEQGKGGKDRTVPLPKGITEKQLKYFPIKCGVRALEIAFKRTAKRAGLLKIKPFLHFHSLRHSFATNAVSKNIPIHHIRTLMGHSNIATTNIYLEANPKDALKDYDKLFWS